MTETAINPWRLPSRPALSWDDSSEVIQRACALQIIEYLPGQIAVQQALWADRDVDWATSRSLPLKTTTIRSVNPRSVYTGNRMDLQVAPVDTFPAITVRCLDSVPADDREQSDQYDQIELSLIVEVWAISGPFTDPVSHPADQDDIDRQLHRLVAAVRGSINSDRSLNSTTLGIRRPPRTRSSLPFALKNSKSNSGDEYLLQAMELTYAVSAMTF